MTPQTYRTDRNNNPAAFTTDIAKQAGLIEGTDYEQGESFQAWMGAAPPTLLYTAKLIGDPVALTIRVINAIGYYTAKGSSRWVYIAIPHTIWAGLTSEQKRDVVGFHYQHEGGVTMRGLFPNYGRV